MYESEWSTLIRPDLRTREAKAAQSYMERKGYDELRPERVIKIEGQPYWYFYYTLENGVLELEVSWQNEWKYHSFYTPHLDSALAGADS